MSFEQQEADVLAWLLERSDVGEVVDLAQEGKDAEARPLLVGALRHLLERREPPAKRACTARCVCVVLMGLHGSGKSALSHLLCEGLGGIHLSFDDHVGRGKQSYLLELRGSLQRLLSSADQNERLLFLDRSHLSCPQRMEVLAELRRSQWGRRGGRLLLLDLSHPEEAFDGDAHVDLCAQRVEQRGAAHPCLHPSSKLRTALLGDARSSESPSSEELAHYDARVSCSVLDSPLDSCLRVLDELQGVRWLDGLRSAEELRPRLEAVWQAYQRAEARWRAGKREESEGPTSCRKKALESQGASEKRGHSEKDACEQVSLYYKIELPEVSEVLAQRGILPASFTPVEHPHTTLLYLGPEGDDVRVAQKSGLPLDQYVAMRDALEALDGEEFEVKMMEIVIEENAACAVVSLPLGVPCADRVPHVTLGTKPGVPPRYANEILQEVKAGRKLGVTSIPLPTPRLLRGRVSIETGVPCPPDG